MNTAIASAITPLPHSPPNTSTKNLYMLDKVSDHIFVILSPLVELLVVFFFCEPRSKNGAFLFATETPHWVFYVTMLFTHSHILLGFLRSHANMPVFVRFKLRFTIVPLICMIFLGFSPSLVIFVSFLGHFWDEWHSIMQTFGFGRIYDAKMGSDPFIGRKMDMWMCFVVGILPYMVSESYLPLQFRDQLMAEYSYLPEIMVNSYLVIFRMLRWPLVIFAFVFTACYTFYYWKLSKKGYQFSQGKLLLFLTTGGVNTIIASFYTIGDAAFLGNISHAIQYYFILYVSERSNWIDFAGFNKLTPAPSPQIQNLKEDPNEELQTHPDNSQSNLADIKSEKINKSKNYKKILWIYVLGVIPIFMYLASFRQNEPMLPALAGFWLLTSLLHFWYDSFIWSVRRQDV